MDLAKSLRLATAIKGCTSVQISAAIEVSVQMISHWRTSGMISLRNLEKLADYFEMPVSEFIKLGEEN